MEELEELEGVLEGIQGMRQRMEQAVKILSAVLQVVERPGRLTEVGYWALLG